VIIVSGELDAEATYRSYVLIRIYLKYLEYVSMKGIYGIG
jgi:hypothetical protein